MQISHSVAIPMCRRRRRRRTGGTGAHVCKIRPAYTRECACLITRQTCQFLCARQLRGVCVCVCLRGNDLHTRSASVRMWRLLCANLPHRPNKHTPGAHLQIIHIAEIAVGVCSWHESVWGATDEANCKWIVCVCVNARPPRPTGMPAIGGGPNGVHRVNAGSA